MSASKKKRRRRGCNWCSQLKPLEGFRLIEKEWCCADCMFQQMRIALNDNAEMIASCVPKKH